MCWDVHINTLCESASKRLDILSSLKYKLSRKTLNIMYTSFIRPVLEYGNIIWDNCTESQVEQLEKVQKRAGRIISGAIVRTPTDIIYQELGWECRKKT